jgi:hypothetical protein
MNKTIIKNLIAFICMNFSISSYGNDLTCKVEIANIVSEIPKTKDSTTVGILGYRGTIFKTSSINTTPNDPNRINVSDKPVDSLHAFIKTELPKNYDFYSSYLQKVFPKNNMK